MQNMLTEEEQALFGPAPTATQIPPADAKAAIVPKTEPANDPKLQPPRKSVIQDEAPGPVNCNDCGTALNSENSSSTRSGVKHIGCPKAVVTTAVPQTPAPAATTTATPAPATEAPKRGRKETPAAPPATAAQTVVHVYELGAETRAFLTSLVESLRAK